MVAFKKILGKNVDVYVGISNYIKDKHIEAGFFKSTEKYTIYNSVKSNVILDLTAANDKRLGFIGRLTYEKALTNFVSWHS
ncbi:hypothetical protein ACJEDO_19200 [Klebsiella pneumoniae]